MDDYADEVESQGDTTSLHSPEIKKATAQSMRNDNGEIVEMKNELAEDNYNIEEVVEKMLTKRDRKIPGTVYKPHNQTVLLLQSLSLG